MAGHSKWANIKHRKGAQDAKRAKAFTKVVREITIAAREGGGDPDANPRLRAAIASARSVNLPNDKIDRAIKKGTGELEGVSLDEVIYEGYGPGGVAILLSTLTDNRNRTTSEIRHLFGKYGGELGSPGSVAWMFERKGIITIPAGDVDEDEVMELVLDAGADDMAQDGEFFEITTTPEAFAEVRDRLEQAGIRMESAEVTMVPQNLTVVEGKKAESLLTLLELLDEHDDVQRVSANCSIEDGE
ncbi:MAG: YebC/PmpR family DNA-binding transcriptional regulator [Acidobacteriota bacterium]|nr:YebC/PmpR family DNA-binding transcriptional regulator [Acidobacteriota bacterium]